MPAATKMKRLLFIAFLTSVFCLPSSVFSQNQHISSYSIYEFLDEMANENLIELNTAVKPYGRKLIAEKLRQALARKDSLTKRQAGELDFFLKDYGKELMPALYGKRRLGLTIPDRNERWGYNKRLDLFYYKDSLLTFSINPILGYSYYANQNGNVTHRWNGADAFGYIGKHFGFYSSLRDNGVSDVLFARGYLTQMQGANYKLYQGQNQKRRDFSEMRGGISYSWKWGSVSLVKDHFVWGNNYNGANIFSGRQPSFPYLNFKLNPAQWIDFNYIHAWLVSQEIDSSRIYGSGTGLRQTFYPKYLAANLFTITPLKKLKMSFGNSIVYANTNVQPGYLIPFMFFKSVDHTLNGAGNNALGQNAQVFFDISSRNIRKIHLYSSLFIDEVSLSRMFDKTKQTNLFSFKAGVRVNNLFVPNTSLIAEYTRTNPWVYTHGIATTTFESNKYNLGHYLRENSDEIYIALRVKPAKKTVIDLSYTHSRKGPEGVYQLVNGSSTVPGTPFMKSIEWENKIIGLKARYEIVNDAFVFLEFNSITALGNVDDYTPSFYWGNPNTITAGVNFGF